MSSGSALYKFSLCVNADIFSRHSLVFRLQILNFIGVRFWPGTFTSPVSPCASSSSADLSEIPGLQDSSLLKSFSTSQGSHLQRLYIMHLAMRRRGFIIVMRFSGASGVYSLGCGFIKQWIWGSLVQKHTHNAFLRERMRYMSGLILNKLCLKRLSFSL